MLNTLRVLLFMILFVPSPLIANESDFEEADIESDEAIANSDAAVEEKKELTRLNIDEKKRAEAEKIAADSAKAKALETEKLAAREVGRLSKEISAKRATIKQFEKEKNQALKHEEKERQRIASAQKEFEATTTQLEEARRAKDEAKSNLERAKEMYREELKRIKLAKQDGENTRRQTQNLKRREASILQKIDVARKASTPAKAKKVSNVPNLNFVGQDCNIRGGPSGKTEVLKKALKGDRVMVLGNQGAWVVVGTPEVSKGFMSKICF